MDDGFRSSDERMESWQGSSNREDFRDWLEQIHREAVMHTEQIQQRHALPQWMRG